MTELEKAQEKLLKLQQEMLALESVIKVKERELRETQLAYQETGTLIAQLRNQEKVKKDED